jgi:hypothetical protein
MENLVNHFLVSVKRPKTHASGSNSTVVGSISLGSESTWCV